MKKLVLIISSLISLTGCGNHMIYIFETASNNSKSINDNWVFDNDTLRITYFFWESKGSMTFDIYNKLDKPIYVDWKNSAFIYNGNKGSYWDEEQLSKTLGSGGYLTLNNGLAVQLNSSNSSSVKPERITAIPPRSSFSKSKYSLFPINKKVTYENNYQESIIPSSYNPKKMTSIIYEENSSANSPIQFRNYLAFVLSENSHDYFYTDNGFYVTTIKGMDFKHYRGMPSHFDKANRPVYGKKSEYNKQTSFYSEETVK